MNKKVKVAKQGKSGFQKFKNRLSFFIILVFAGFVFYMGWIQIRIPEGQYALIYTKTGGYDRTLIAPGQFVWRWENLFPGNLSMHFIDLVTVPGEFQLDGTLPSGELYGEFIHEPEAFNFHFRAEYRFSIKEDQLVSLIGSGQYDAESLNTGNRQYISDVNRTIGNYLTVHSPLSPDSIGQTEEALILKITDDYPQFRIENLHITSFVYPDLDLYEKTKYLYLEQLAVTKEIDKKTEQTNEKVETITARKMDLLRLYGEILSEFPVLLQYFELEKEKLDPSLFIESDPSAVSP